MTYDIKTLLVLP